MEFGQRNTENKRIYIIFCGLSGDYPDAINHGGERNPLHNYDMEDATNIFGILYSQI